MLGHHFRRRPASNIRDDNICQNHSSDCGDSSGPGPLASVENSPDNPSPASTPYKGPALSPNGSPRPYHDPGRVSTTNFLGVIIVGVIVFIVVSAAAGYWVKHKWQQGCYGRRQRRARTVVRPFMLSEKQWAADAAGSARSTGNGGRGVGNPPSNSLTPATMAQMHLPLPAKAFGPDEAFHGGLGAPPSFQMARQVGDGYWDVVDFAAPKRISARA